MEKYIEKWNLPINEVRIGGRLVGGARNLPFLEEKNTHDNYSSVNPPLFAIEISDIPPRETVEPLSKVWQDVWLDPVLWAKKAISVGADAIVLRFQGAHPDNGDRTPQDCARIAVSVSDGIGSQIPLIIIGSELPSKDSLVIPVISQALEGRNVLLGMATKDNYKFFAKSALDYGHSIITESPVDINLAKQLHILLSTQMNFPIKKLVLHQTTGALGYGYEYCYSIMERTRIAGLEGDQMLAVPMINFVGKECWRLKESIISDEEAPDGWGSYQIRGIMWETVCAAGYLQCGADILVMYHPDALAAVKNLARKLISEKEDK